MIDERFLLLASAHRAMSKAGWARYQTGDGGRTKTIISVDHEEAVVIERAMKDYLNKWENELKKENEK